MTTDMMTILVQFGLGKTPNTYKSKNFRFREGKYTCLHYSREKKQNVLQTEIEMYANYNKGMGVVFYGSDDRYLPYTKCNVNGIAPCFNIYKIL